MGSSLPLDVILQRVYWIMDFHHLPYIPLEEFPKIIVTVDIPEHINGYFQINETHTYIVLREGCYSLEAALAHVLTRLIQDELPNFDELDYETSCCLVEKHYQAVYVSTDKRFLSKIHAIKNASLRESSKLRHKLFASLKSICSKLNHVKRSSDSIIVAKIVDQHN